MKQLEDLGTRPESGEYAEAPATPMLVEEANLSSVQEAIVSDYHVESVAHNINGEMEVKQSATKGCSEPAVESVDRFSVEGSLPSPSCPEPKPVLSSSQCQNGVMEVLEGTEGIQNSIERVEGTSLCIDSQTETQNTEKLEARPDENAGVSSCSPDSFELEKQCPAVVDVALEKEDSPKKSSENVVCQLGSHYSTRLGDGLKVHDELKDHESTSVLQEGMQSKFTKGLQRCNAYADHQDKSLLQGDKQCPAADVIEVTVDGNQTVEPVLIGKVQTHAGELLEQFYNEANLDLPAPEKMLSVSDTNANKPNDLLVESTPNKDGPEEETRQISGRKHSLTESTVTMHSLETFGFSLSKGRAESIPDDNDLLSSILGIVTRSFYYGLEAPFYHGKLLSEVVSFYFSN